VAAGLEAVSNTWNFNAYALVPVGTKEYRLNSNYNGGALDTYGLDVGYAITPDFKASVGYYYQQGDLGTADGSGVNGRLAYNISNGLTAGVNLSYDQAFETRFSADLKYRFGGNSNKTASEKKAWQTPVIQSLTEAVRHRDVRVHDAQHPTCRPTKIGKNYACVTYRGISECWFPTEQNPTITHANLKCKKGGGPNS